MGLQWNENWTKALSDLAGWWTQMSTLAYALSWRQKMAKQYQDQLKGVPILLSNCQAGPGRKVKQEQEENISTMYTLFSWPLYVPTRASLILASESASESDLHSFQTTNLWFQLKNGITAALDYACRARQSSLSREGKKLLSTTYQPISRSL